MLQIGTFQNIRFSEFQHHSPHENAEIQISNMVQFPIGVLGNNGSAIRKDFVEDVEQYNVR